MRVHVECCVKGELFKFRFFEFTVEAIQNRFSTPVLTPSEHQLDNAVRHNIHLL